MTTTLSRAAGADGARDPLDWSHHRFLALDGLRFVAALVVVWYHCSMAQEIEGLVPHGYLMVDFFFALSGFVLAHAYDDRLRRGGFLGPFLLRRVVRLYPLCIVASALGFLINPDLHPSVRDMLFGFGLIPQFHGWLFPVDIPLWSLFFEAVVNVLYAVVLARLPDRVLVGIIVVATCLLLAGSYANDGLNVGGIVDTWYLGIVRALQPFGVGILLYRWRRRAPDAAVFRAALPALAVVPLAAVLYGIAQYSDIERANDVYDAVVVVIAFPLLLVCAAAVRIPTPGHAARAPVGRSPGSAAVAAVRALRLGQRLAPLLALGGEVSYPLYVVHYPLLGAFAPVQTNGRAEAYATIAKVTLATCAAAWFVYRVYDLPVRRWLAAHVPGLGRARQARAAG